MTGIAPAWAVVVALGTPLVVALVLVVGLAASMRRPRAPRPFNICPDCDGIVCLVPGPPCSTCNGNGIAP